MKSEINIIFDFDGTIADSFLPVMQGFNSLASEFGFRNVDLNEIEKIKNLSSYELIKYFRIPFYRLPKILIRAREMMREEMQNIPIIPNMNVAIQVLHNAGARLIILSSNSAENISKWLQLHNMDQLFSRTYGKTSFFGKAHSLKRLIHKNEMNKSRTYYVGDETRDIEAAKKCQIASVAVTWGFNSESILSEFHPDFLAKKPEDLLKIICV